MRKRCEFKIFLQDPRDGNISLDLMQAVKKWRICFGSAISGCASSEKSYLWWSVNLASGDLTCTDEG